MTWSIARWAAINAALYLVVVALGRARPARRIDLPWLVISAWLVTTIRYTPWMHGMAVEVWSGACGRRCLLSWTVLTVIGTVGVSLAAAAFAWCSRNDTACLLVLLVAADWVLWAVFGVQLQGFRLDASLVVWAVPLLGLATLTALGPYALRQALATS